MSDKGSITQTARLSDEELELLAYVLEEEGVEPVEAQGIPRRPAGLSEIPLSFGQRRLWFLDRLKPGDPVYNLSTAVRLKGRLDVHALEQTLTEIVRRHEVLRTTFELAGVSPVQVVSAPAPQAIPLTDLRHLPAQEREAEAERLVSEETLRPFDLTRGPLMRGLLLRLEEDVHLIVVTMHHIVSDGWSRGVLIQEVAALYEAFSRGEASPLAELPIQYADYAVWQREWLQGEVLEAQLSYWREQLRDLPTLALPTDRPRPSEQSFKGARHNFVLPRNIVEGLRAVAQAHEATAFMVLLAAYSVLLTRYSGQTEVSVGAPIANRRRAELEGLIGFFVNTLVLRVRVEAGEGFGSLVRRVREVCLGAYAHQDVPFEKLVEELQPERSLSHAPLFQVALVLQNVPRSSLDLQGLSLTPHAVKSETAKFDLTLLLDETDESMLGTLEYNTDLFDHETITRMLGHFTTLLEAVTENPDLPLAAVPLLGGEEERMLLERCRGPVADFSRPEGLHQLFEEQVRRAPDSTALVFGGERVTYRELNRRANQLAHYLRERGVGPEVLVALCVERSPEMIVGILGILKAGGAYVPLDPAYPTGRLAFMIEDARPPVLLTQSRLLETLPAYAGHVVTLDSDWEEIARRADTDLAWGASADCAAYVIYTSGSTGKPKGAILTHANVTRLMSATQHWFDFSERDVWTMFHSYAFDFSVWELWGALLYGGRLVVVPYWVSRDPEALARLLLEEGVTVLNQTPSAFRQLMQAEAARGSDELRLVVFGGEALEPGSLSEWVGRRGDSRPQLVNMYGITETCVHVTYRRLSAGDVSEPRGSLIGVPIPDLQVYVLDEMLRPVPDGVIGEMYVAGAGLARGYLNRADLTAERFIPHPFGARPGERLYRTGDLARFDRRGELEYLGRADQQVKVRGFRIELGEIESALAQHEAVREAVVVPLEDEGGGKRLVAYLTLKLAARVEELRAHLKERLPEYMVPSAFVVLEELPLTPNGKLDRRALPAPEASWTPEFEDAYAAPRNEVEDLLAVIWAEVLGVERVGIHDNFFALGGDSVRSVGVLALAKERGLEFSLQQLFRHQTIAELAREVVGLEGDAAAADPVEPFGLVSEEERPKLPPGLEDAYPLTALQAGMLFHMELTPESPLYHNINSWYLRAPFDAERFREATQHAVARHAILRTSFDLSSYGEPLQLVHRAAQLPVEVTDLRHLSPEGQSAALDEFVEAEKDRRFDLSKPPLLRFHFHLRSDETFQFTLTESHPIFDGWSLNSTLAEIFTNYFTLLRGGDLGPPRPPTATFRDFVRMERATLESEASRQFWDDKLRGMTFTRLPRRRDAGREEGGPRVRQTYVLIPPEVCEGLNRVARNNKVPVKSVLLAAHMKVLSFVSGQGDVVGGVVSNGRPESLDGEQVRGLFLNTVPFRMKLPEGSWAELVRKTFEAEWELLPHRRYPLVALQKQAGGQALFEAQFNYVHFHVLEGVLQSGEIEVLADDKKRVLEEAHFPLTAAFSRNPLSPHILLMLQYDSHELHGEQVEAFGRYYVEALSAIARTPEAPHASHSLLPAEERQRLLAQWNRTARDYGGDACLHELFERQAARTPDATALVSEEESLSYAELDERSTRLALRLRALGAGPGQFVGVCLERGAGMIVGLLGVLKAGAAYVPLDPTNPPSRLAYMLSETRVPVIITERSLTELLPEGSARVLCLDDPEAREAVEVSSLEGGAATAALREQVKVSPDHPAYVIYTSGSTGRPKGVVVSHRSINNRILWTLDAFPLGPEDRLLQKTVFSFDASIWEIFAPLFSGAQLVMARPGGHQDSAYLVRAVVEHSVTVLQLVPSMLRVVLEEPSFRECRTLRRMFCGGEVLPREVVERFHSLLDAELVNLYGPTEVSIDATYWECSRGETGSVPIGRPIGNMRVYVLDAAMEPVPEGVAGELYVGGVGLAFGYLNQPVLTAERFVPDPHGGRVGGRLYRTGDVGRRRADGSIEYVGRADSQVKIRGYRIEPGEAEAALRGHEWVREAAVVARDEDGGERRLVGYVVIDEARLRGADVAAESGNGSGADVSALVADGLREYLRERLPQPLVPASFVVMERMPVLPNGKLDKSSLPDPGRVHAGTRAEYVAPRNEVERVVAEVWAEVLGLAEVGVHDNFFELGGHSLRLLQTHLKLREAFGEDLQMVELFQYPTVSALASHLSRKRGEGDSLAESEKRAEARKGSAGRQRRRRQSQKAGGE